MCPVPDECLGKRGLLQPSTHDRLLVAKRELLIQGGRPFDARHCLTSDGWKCPRLYSLLFIPPETILDIHGGRDLWHELVSPSSSTIWLITVGSFALPQAVNLFQD